MSAIVAERFLRKSDSGAQVVARIFVPEKIGQSSEWSCKIEVQGLGEPYERSIIGVDSFQALYLALRVLCACVERHEQNLVFLDGEAGDCALPLIMPWSFGAALKAEMYQLINSKIEERFSDSA